MITPGSVRPIAAIAHRQERLLAALKRVSPLALELSLIIVWAVFIGRDYLNFDSLAIPAGREYSSAIQAHHLWTRFQECGICALWDGSERGGFPAFVDPLASALHPLVIMTTLLFGVVNGSKAALICSFALAGLAQWWLAHELRLSRFARLWGSLMVMVGGHLSGRMELGLFSVVLSTAMVSLTFPAAIRLNRTGQPRDAVIFAALLAMLAVSGQGYMQAGFLAMSPAYLILLAEDRPYIRHRVARFALAAGLATLLAAPFFVPLLHFWPNFVKDNDPSFTAAQPFFYYLLNLFIDDREFLFSRQLGKLPYPHLYTMFIGWIPVLLAVLTVRYARQEDRRPLLFLASSGVLAIFIGSALPFKWLEPIVPFLAALRFAPMIGGLAIPAIVALAAYTLDKLLKLTWSITIHIGINVDNAPVARQEFNLKWLIVFPLLIALWQGYKFSRLWLYTQPLDDNVINLLEYLKTPTLQWVQPPFGEHPFIEPAVAMGLKLSPGIMTWRWRDRAWPMAVLEANRQGSPPEAEYDREIAGVPVYARDNYPYAAVTSTADKEACTAAGNGGWLTVQCDTTTAGVLLVAENMWSGWHAWRDGVRIPLFNNQWIQAEAPAGKHTYLFRYLPWDVPLGLFLFVIGCLSSLWVWRRSAP